jgi:hypothetical protein
MRGITRWSLLAAMVAALAALAPATASASTPQSLNPGVNLNNLHVGQLLNVDC